MRLLIAEDDKALGLFLSRGLETDGYRVHLVCDGGAAVEAFRQEMPDLTILDLNLPVKDGEQVLEELRALDADLPVLVLTARQEVNARVRCLDHGADDLMGAETRRSFEAGREQGRIEGRQAEHGAQTAAQATAEQLRVRQAAEMIERFAVERDQYLQAVEREVVVLALAVAARILRREAQMDPLLLTGAVRVALGQLSGSTQVRLPVPAAELGLWSETAALFPRLRVKPVVLAGEGMRLGDYMIETELGSVDLGIRAQLGEIERGFFDRAGSRKAGAPLDEAPGVEQEVRT
jgi:flagellar assembly protein FliH